MTGMQYKDELFVYVSAHRLANLSKECLVSLLEHAEEVLHCKVALIFFKLSLPDTTRKKCLRDFKFLGFELLSPTHSLCPAGCNEYMFMAYDIDPGGESGSDSD